MYHTENDVEEPEEEVSLVYVRIVGVDVSYGFLLAFLFKLSIAVLIFLAVVVPAYWILEAIWDGVNSVNWETGEPGR